MAARAEWSTPGALTELLKLVAGRDFLTVRREDTHVLLVQSAVACSPTPFSQRLGRYAERTLSGRRVDVRTRMHITAADDHQVTLSDGSTVHTRTVVWAGRRRTARSQRAAGAADKPQRSRSGG